jgi:Ribose/Galactose Isomerase
MSGNGQPLHWPKRVLTADDLARHLNGQSQLILSPRTVITPLAVEHLKANGVSVTRQAEEAKPSGQLTWGYSQERPFPVVQTAVEALRQDGVALKELPALEGLVCRWAKALAECVQRGECQGGVIFCGDPGLVCCVANKVAGLRAVPVATVAQAARATLTLGANLLAVEVPGRTFFEVRQILRTVCACPGPACPAGVAETLKELDGHAHR